MTALTHSQDFISINKNQFMLGDSAYNFLGFNAYYLFSEAALGREYITDEVFDAANGMGVKVIRTWAFYESDGVENQAVIRSSPYEYNENALAALDYVIFKAKEKNVRIILTFVNSNPHYGGIPQYLLWAKKYLGKDLLRNDFFVNDSLKSWYKDYINHLLNRTNSLTGILYKDEPAIFSFELINEAVNSGNNPSAVFNWYKEMASYFKSIDFNHLLSTGECGEDDDRSQYSDVNLFYNSSKFLFNGSKGTSYSRNLCIPEIDYGSFHLYTDGWGLNSAAGINWIKEHLFIAETQQKPALLSEFGSRENKSAVYKKWLDEVSSINCRSAIIWHYVHKDVKNNDAYGFSMDNQDVVSALKNFAAEIELPVPEPILPMNAELYQNYPNPFNPVTVIKYSLSEDDEILMELYTSLGEKVGVLEEGFKKKGTYELVLSFESAIYSSGTYIYTLRTSKGKSARKLILLK